MNLKIPTLSEIIKYNYDFNSMKIDWKKFIHIEDLAKQKISEIGKKANRYLSYYICYLTTNNFLERLSEDSYIIFDAKADSKKLNAILNPRVKNIIYGFSRKEDASQYSNLASPISNGELIIDRYKEIFENS